MADLGSITLLLSLALAAYAALGSLVGQWKRAPELVISARYAAYLTPLMLAVSTTVLVAAFVTHNLNCGTWRDTATWPWTPGSPG